MRIEDIKQKLGIDDSLEAYVAELEAEIERLREALDFYTEGAQDDGETARRTLDR